MKQLVIINPVNSINQSVRMLKITDKKRKCGKSFPIHGLEPIISVITGQCLTHCATDANIYESAYTSVTIHNIIYLFNINSRKLGGHYRSWIEFLNEPYKVSILDRSIQLDNTTLIKYNWQ